MALPGAGGMAVRPAAAIGPSCFDTPCDPPLVYGGYQVQRHPRVFLVFWGPRWNTDISGTIAAQKAVFSKIRGSNWSGILTQYYETTDGPGHARVFNDAVLAGTWIDTATPPSSVGPSQVGDESVRAANARGWSTSADTQIIVFTQHGTNVPGFNTDFCAWHFNGAAGAYALVPYQADAINCTGYGKGKAVEASTFVATHEYAEAVTDPVSGGWVTKGGEEIADLCVGAPATSVGGHFASRLWDNSTHTCASSHSSWKVEKVSAGIFRIVAPHVEWHVSNDNIKTAKTFNYGVASTDQPVVGDWDGNGTDTAGVVRKVGVHLEWHLSNNDGNTATIFDYGVAATDQPVVGDWDGNGTSTAGIVRKVGGHLEWHITNNNATTAKIFDYGLETDQPVVGDWGANGTDDPGVVRLVDPLFGIGPNMEWHLANDSAATIFTIDFGDTTKGDVPIVGDWDGDGRTSIGYTRLNGIHVEWHPADEQGFELKPFNYGVAATDQPVAGNWDGK
jgi:hypothetical protein